MCFSATASFTVAGLTSVAGAACLWKTRRAAEVPLATFPLLFAAQQAIEGLVWVRIGAGELLQSGALVTAFLFFAEVLWPLLVPAAVFAIEPDRRRRFLFGGLFVVAVAVSGYLLYAMSVAPYDVVIQGGSLRYTHDFPALPGGKVLYAACTTLPLLLSSHPWVRLMGGVVMVGLLVSQWFFAQAFISVWCFFAAAASAILYFHFHLQSRCPEGARKTA